MFYRVSSKTDRATQETLSQKKKTKTENKKDTYNNIKNSNRLRYI